VFALLLNAGANIEATNAGGYTPLHLGAARGNLDGVRFLIASGARVDAHTRCGFTPLYLALRGHNAAVAKLLRASGGVAQDRETRASICWVVAAGDLARIRALLPKQTNLDARFEAGGTLLHLASRQGSIDIARELLSKGANIEARDDEGRTALHLAAQYDHESLAKLLLAKGANVNAQDGAGETPLFIVANHAEPHVKLARLLLASGADGTIRSRDHIAPRSLTELIDELGTELVETCQEGQVDRVKELLDKGANIDFRADDGRAPLHAAVSAHRADLVRLLLSRGATVLVKDRDGVTPRDLAVLDGWTDMAHTLWRAERLQERQRVR
jgi:uncharacterized protein